MVSPSFFLWKEARANRFSTDFFSPLLYSSGSAAMLEFLCLYMFSFILIIWFSERYMLTFQIGGYECILYGVLDIIDNTT